MTANATFVEWLRDTRRRTKTSQQDLATYLGVPQQTVARIELGQRPVRLDEADAIAAFFGVALDGVFAGVPPCTPGTDLARTRQLLTRLRSAIDAELGGRRG